jgi:precorrin-8X/cobalt-precorrin-8 methylmutase
MERIILVGHGSPKEDANNVEAIGALLHRMIHPDCRDRCVGTAYLQFADPDIAATIDACAAEGAQRIIVHPFFLYAGMHVTKDIPAIIDEARKRHPGVEIVYSAPLGVHEHLARVVLERIGAAASPAAGQIERQSFEIISGEVDLSDLPAEQRPIVQRVIHATADFDFKESLLFHPDAVKKGVEAIRDGGDILTDVEMVRTGINKRLLTKWGGTVLCGLSADPEDGQAQGMTRAEAGIERALKERAGNIGVIAVGNAPTALLKVIEMLKAGPPDRAPLVVGVPVGFVRAVESKAILSTQAFPFITNLSRKGGTPVAVSIVNALLIMAEGDV